MLIGGLSSLEVSDTFRQTSFLLGLHPSGHPVTTDLHSWQNGSH